MIRRRQNKIQKTESGNQDSEEGRQQQNLKHEEVANGEELQVYSRYIGENLNEDAKIQKILDMNDEILQGQMEIGSAEKSANKGFLQQLFPTDDNPSDHLAVWTKIKLEL